MFLFLIKNHFDSLVIFDVNIILYKCKREYTEAICTMRRFLPAEFPSLSDASTFVSAEAPATADTGVPEAPQTENVAAVGLSTVFAEGEDFGSVSREIRKFLNEADEKQNEASQKLDDIADNCSDENEMDKLLSEFHMILPVLRDIRDVLLSYHDKYGNEMITLQKIQLVAPISLLKKRKETVVRSAEERMSMHNGEITMERMKEMCEDGCTILKACLPDATSSNGEWEGHAIYAEYERKIKSLTDDLCVLHNEWRTDMGLFGKLFEVEESCCDKLYMEFLQQLPDKSHPPPKKQRM